MIQIKERGSKSPVSNCSSNSSTENGDSNKKISCHENHLLPTSLCPHTSHPYAPEFSPSSSYWHCSTYRSQETAKRENEESSSPKRQNGSSDYTSSCSSPTSSTRQYCETLTSEKPNTAPTTPVPKPLPIPQKGKHLRISRDQAAELEWEFFLDIYCNASRAIAIANRLGLSKIKIRCWFRNRRRKLRLFYTQLCQQSTYQPPTAVFSPFGWY